MVKHKPLTTVMLDALEYYGRLATDPDFILAPVATPRIGTRCALIARGLITAGTYHDVTEDGWVILGNQRACAWDRITEDGK